MSEGGRSPSWAALPPSRTDRTNIPKSNPVELRPPMIFTPSRGKDVFSHVRYKRVFFFLLPREPRTVLSSIDSVARLALDAIGLRLGGETKR